MEKTCILTICARNYLGLAKAMLASVRAQMTHDLIIYVVDEFEDLQEQNIYSAYRLIADAHGENTSQQISFKYDITEFCTFVKPYCLFHALNVLGYTTAVYLDPDIYVFSTLQPLLDFGEEQWITLTPHIIYASKTEGPRLDRELMATGIFNLGFIALKNCKQSLSFLEWWKVRLFDQCYVDPVHGLFTDQKWIDLIPSLFPPQSIHISRNPGTNLAPWNFHEREIIVTNAADSQLFLVQPRHPDLHSYQYTITKYPLVFVHFSGYDYSQICKTKFLSQSNINNLPQYEDLFSVFDVYAEHLFAHKDLVLSCMENPYRFSVFENDRPISMFYRRLYAEFISTNSELVSPYSVSRYSFYHILRRSGLLFNSNLSGRLDKANKYTLQGITWKITLFKLLLKWLKCISGVGNYYLIIRSLRYFSRLEAHAFLLNMRK